MRRFLSLLVALQVFFSANIAVASQSVNWNGTSYSIPDAGETGWEALTSFLVALGNNAAVTEEIKQAIRVATTTPVTVSSTTDAVVATKLAVAGAVAVTLPAGVNGRWFAIVDQTGDAATNNITITPNGAETINGAATYVINDNRGAVILAYSTTNTRWNVVARYTAGVILTNPMDSAGDMIVGGTAGVATKLDSGTAGQWFVSAGAAAPTWTNTTTTGKTVTGSADEVQLRLTGNATQNANTLLVEASNGDDTFRVQGETAGSAVHVGKDTGDPSMGQTETSASTPSYSFQGDLDTGMYRSGANQLSLATNGVEQVRVGSSGGVLIDGSADAVQLTVKGHTTQTNVLSKFQNDNAGNAETVFEVDLTGSETYRAGGSGYTHAFNTSNGSITTPTVSASGNLMGQLNFRLYDGGAYRSAARIAAEVDATPGSTDYPGRVIVQTVADGGTSPQVRFVVDSFGTIYYGDKATLTSGGGPATFNTTAGSGEACDAKCAANESSAGLDTGSGICLAAWQTSNSDSVAATATGSCSSTAAFAKTCYCAGAK